MILRCGNIIVHLQTSSHFLLPHHNILLKAVFCVSQLDPFISNGQKGHTECDIERFNIKIKPDYVAGGDSVSLTTLASKRFIAGYGGGMSSAKASLESDTRVNVLYDYIPNS